MIALILAAATTAAPTPAKAPAAPPKRADLGAIAATNPFDPQRKAWNPPPEPPGPGLTEEDVKVHGVILAGQTKKALLELVSPRLTPPAEHGKPAPRPYRVVSVGDDVGGYRLVDITPTQLVFAQGGSQSTLAFTVAKGRAMSGGAVAAPEQVAVVVPVTMPTVLEGVAPPEAPTETPAAAAPAPTAAPLPQPAAPQATADNNAQTNNQPSGNGGAQAGMSLLEAIQAARARAAANGGQTVPQGNPFLGAGASGTGK